MTKQVGYVDVDRGDLTAVLDQFLQAVVENDVSAAPLAPGFRSTENTVEVKPGEGIWSTAVALGELRRRYADPVTGQVGHYGLIEEAEAAGPAIVALRLRVANGQVSEAEWVIGRDDKHNMYLPAGVVASPPPEGLVRDEPRSSREDMIAAADSYYNGIQAYDWSIIRGCPGCYRVENGGWVTGRYRTPKPADGITQPMLPLAMRLGSCAEFHGETPLERPVPVLDRHYFVDEEAGIIWNNAILKSGFQSFAEIHARQAGQPARTETVFPGLYAAELFKVEQGRIRGLHVVMQVMPMDWDGATGAGFATSAS